jgi:hypothetical protein
MGNLAMSQRMSGSSSLVTLVYAKFILYNPIILHGITFNGIHSGSVRIVILLFCIWWFHVK